MQKKIEYVVTKINQPTAKTIRQFHEQIHKFMERVTDTNNKTKNQIDYPK